MERDETEAVVSYSILNPTGFRNTQEISEI
jgi:hypothetical protein